MPTLSWIAMAGFAIVCLRSIKLYYRFVVRRPFFAAVLALAMATIFGMVGRDFGLINLFWDEQPLRQFLAGFSAGTLALTLFWMGFDLEKGRPWPWKQAARSFWSRSLTGLGSTSLPSSIEVSREFFLWITAMAMPLLLALWLPCFGWPLPSSEPGHWQVPLVPWALPLGAVVAASVVLMSVLVFPGLIRHHLPAPLVAACLVGVWSAALYREAGTAPIALTWSLVALSFAWYLTSERTRFPAWASVIARGTLLLLAVVGIQEWNGKDPFKLQYDFLKAEYPSWAEYRSQSRKLVDLSGPLTPGTRATQVELLARSTAELDRRIAANPEDPALRHDRGILRLRSGNVSTAVVELGRASELDPKSGKFAADLGAALCLDGEPDRALVALSRAIELGHDTRTVRCNMGTSFAQKKRWDEARKAYTLALPPKGATGPEKVFEARVHLLDGISRLYEKDFDNAQYNLSLAENLDPESGLASYFLGNLLDARGQATAALNSYDRAKEIDPALAPLAFMSKSDNLHKLGMHQEENGADEAVLDTIEIPAEAEVRLTSCPIGDELLVIPQARALILSAKADTTSHLLGATARVLEDMERALRCDPSNPRLLADKAVLMMDTGNLLEALRAIDAALEIRPNLTYAWTIKGMIYNRLKDFTKAIGTLEKATLDQPDDVTAYQALGDAWYEKFLHDRDHPPSFARGMPNPPPDDSYKLARSIGAIKKAIALNPNQFSAYTDLAKVYLAADSLSVAPSLLGERERPLDLAVAALKKVINLDKYDPVHYDMLSQCFSRQDRRDEAIAMIRKATRVSLRNSDMLESGNTSHPAPWRVDDRSALDAWLKRVHPKPGAPKPKLVVVAVSGGGIAASYWTALCLSEIERRCAEFPRHVRVVTGASGGMLGASYYVASLAQDLGPCLTEIPELKARVDALPSKISNRLRDVPAAMARESLTPVVRRMLLFDLPSIFCPARQTNDRGMVIEKAWEENTGRVLAWPLSALAPAESRGCLPSLLITPMTEKGTFLLIGNLDLDGLAGGRDFFDLFPTARDKMTLAGAIRMNAAFPIVSPAVSLPTRDADRVGDAGYLDNHGIWLSTEWIWKNKGWLTKNTSGVILLQIRAYPKILQARAASGTGDLRAGLQWITTPFELLLQVRQSMMKARNEEAVRKVEEYFNVDPDDPFFHPVTLESGYAEIPLSWSLTTSDRERLEGSLREVDGVGAADLQRIANYRHCNEEAIQEIIDLLGR